MDDVAARVQCSAHAVGVVSHGRPDGPSAGAPAIIAGTGAKLCVEQIRPVYAWGRRGAQGGWVSFGFSR